MKIYNVILNDRHTDTEVYSFVDSEKAVDWAREQAKKSARFPEDYKEHDYGKEDGWLFFANYSCESDHIYVVETELNGELK